MLCTAEDVQVYDTLAGQNVITGLMNLSKILQQNTAPFAG